MVRVEGKKRLPARPWAWAGAAAVSTRATVPTDRTARARERRMVNLLFLIVGKLTLRRRRSDQASGAGGARPSSAERGKGVRRGDDISAAAPAGAGPATSRLDPWSAAASVCEAAPATAHS